VNVSGTRHLPLLVRDGPFFRDVPTETIMGEKIILLIGAGRSSAHLVRYLLNHATAERWKIRVGEMDVEGARKRIGEAAALEIFELDARDQESRFRALASSDLVISMLPAALHIEVVRDCLVLRRNVITPSYVPDAMWPLHSEAQHAGVLLLNEMGVDPGIDHMSAMRIIDRIRAEGGEVTHFESYTGGLVAPASDTNPWHYKVTWNPRNVVLAGAGGPASFRQEGELKFIPYTQLFTRVAAVEVPGYGSFEGYANRDSLSYRETYGLQDAATLLRGTLRKEGFCAAWNALIQIGLTDDTLHLPDPESLTWRMLTAAFSPEPSQRDPKSVFIDRFGWTPEVVGRLEWLGIFDDIPLGITEGTPAQALQRLIEERWKLEPEDRDLLVMWHGFRYRKDDRMMSLRSWLAVEGEDEVYTAMSRTVGLPIGIAARCILSGEWRFTGIMLPTHESIYGAVLTELEQYGVVFHEEFTTG